MNNNLMEEYSFCKSIQYVNRNIYLKLGAKARNDISKNHRSGDLSEK